MEKEFPLDGAQMVFRGTERAKNGPSGFEKTLYIKKKSE